MSDEKDIGYSERTEVRESGDVRQGWSGTQLSFPEPCDAPDEETVPASCPPGGLRTVLQEKSARLGKANERISEINRKISDMSKEAEFLEKKRTAYDDRRLCEKGLIMEILMPETADLPPRYVFDIIRLVTEFPEVTGLISRCADHYRAHIEKKERNARGMSGTDNTNKQMPKGEYQ
ncbi:MAG: hypothetical protein IJU57_02755 [Clostridia bacterium]|nr:hypothetical protein [Clostridia bacterium]